jgi:Mn2+/Fe2+ NRAMP family transporter
LLTLFYVLAWIAAGLLAYFLAGLALVSLLEYLADAPTPPHEAGFITAAVLLWPLAIFILLAEWTHSLWKGAPERIYWLVRHLSGKSPDKRERDIHS